MVYFVEAFEVIDEFALSFMCTEYLAWETSGLGPGNNYRNRRSPATALLKITARSLDITSDAVFIKEGPGFPVAGTFGGQDDLPAQVSMMMHYLTEPGSVRSMGRTYIPCLTTAITVGTDGSHCNGLSSLDLVALWQDLIDRFPASGVGRLVLPSYQHDGVVYNPAPVSPIQQAIIRDSLLSTQARRIRVASG